MPPITSFRCRTCGAIHDGLPMAWGFDGPAHLDAIPPLERAERVAMTPDVCIIDNEHHFIRGRIEVPVLDGEGVFAWVVWCSLSPTNFERALDLWSAPERTNEPPYFGWLSNAFPGYPTTMNLKTQVRTMPPGEAPKVDLEPTDHPLSVEQRTGITMQRIIEIAETWLHR